MTFLHVIQHTSADYLGLMEDHLEGRHIRFRYFRPFTEGTPLPSKAATVDGLVLLGGGPWGTVSGPILPSLADEIALTRVYLMSGKPVIGLGLGAQILALAADGGSKAAALTFSVGEARRCADTALNGFLPERFPHVVYMRDHPVPPAYAATLAHDSDGQSAIFQLGSNVFGFSGHPGFKRAMAEDLIMEFEEAPDAPAATLDALTMVQRNIESALVQTMTGLVQMTGLMRGNTSS
jgi:GMP synthase-like glutamine amidotransferase